MAVFFNYGFTDWMSSAVYICHIATFDSSIVTVMRQLERMLTNYAVPIAFIHGDKLADLALEFELEQQPSEDDLLGVIVNKEDVQSIIKRPVSG